MPLMMATRPLNSISRVAATPISMPPTAADMGVKFTIDPLSLPQRRPARKRKNLARYQAHKRYDHEQAPPARITGLREQLPKRDDNDQSQVEHVDGTDGVHIEPDCTGAPLASFSRYPLVCQFIVTESVPLNRKATLPNTALTCKPAQELSYATRLRSSGYRATPFGGHGARARP